MKELLIIFTLMAPYLFCAQESDSLGEVIISLPDSDTNKVHALVDLAAIHYHDNLDTSKILVTEALIISKKQNYTRGIGFSNTAMSGYFFQKGELDSALIYANKGAEILESIDDQQHILAAYNNMALIYNNMEKPEQAINIYLKIFDIIKENETSIQHMAICNNLAVAFGNNGQLKASKKWFMKVTEYGKEMGHPMGLVYGYNGTAGVNIELNELEDAISNSKMGLQISLENGMDKTAIESYQNLGKIYRKKGNYNKSIEYLKSGTELAEKIDSKRNLEVLYSELSLNYESLGQYKKALTFNQAYHNLKDSIFAENKVELIEELEKKYETVELEKKQVQIELEKEQLAKDIELEEIKNKQLIQENELEGIRATKNRNYLIASIVIALLMGVSGFLFFNQFRNRKKAELEKLELEELSKRLEVENQYKDSELKAIKAQMNPHFMFNALNSIQDYIILNEKELASDYLGTFADLMRLYLNQSNQDLISIEDEIKTLKLYIELESLRQEDMSFEVECDDEELLDCKIPPMLIQPYVENAIKHGLWHIPNTKKLKVRFFKYNNVLNCEIVDNGIGLAASKEKNKLKGKHQSFSTGANENRLKIIQEKFGNKLSIVTEDVVEKSEVKGTRVNIEIPLNLS